MGGTSTLFRSIGILNRVFAFEANRWVGVRDGFVVYVGPEAPADASSYDEVVDGKGRLLMPAFYNAHAHAPMSLLRGYAENCSLQDWLTTWVFPFEDRLSDPDVRSATELSVAEMLARGCASMSDMYYHDDARCEAVESSGFKCNVSRAITAFGNPDYDAMPQAACVERLFETWDGACDGRIKVDFSIHAEYTNNEPVCRRMAEVCAEHGAIMHVHVSETRSEHEECKRRHDGLTPTRFLERCGVFRSPVLAAHCVWIEEDDIDCLLDHDATVVCNPASNMKLGSGFAPVPHLLERGVNVALGTDGAASNNAQDMLRELYLFSVVYKGSTGDARVVTPAQALFAATRAGALAQGRRDCGLLDVGMRADLTMLDVDKPWMAPGTDMVSNVVYAASSGDVVLTMVDGRVLFRSGTWPTIDVEKAAAEVGAACGRIRAELGADRRAKAGAGSR